MWSADSHELSLLPAHTTPPGFRAVERAVGTLERERRLLELLRTPGMSRDRLVQAFLEPPLYRDGSASGFGTLYTAV